MQRQVITATIIQLVILGVFSGFATQFFINSTSFNKPVLFGTSIWPGVVFGAVIAWGALRLGRISYFNTLIVVLATTLSWIAAVEVAKKTMDEPLPEAMSFATAGLIGSAGVVFGLLLVSQRARAIWVTLLPLTIIAGTIIAALVPTLDKLIGDPLGWVFFPLWQTAIVLTVAKCLVQEE